MKKITQKFVDEYFLRKENQRNPDSSKYDFGHVLVVAGSVGMLGAAVLAAKASLRVGAGAVTCAVPKGLVSAAMEHFVEVMVLPVETKIKDCFDESSFEFLQRFLKEKRIDVIALGCGIGRRDETIEFVGKMLGNINIPMIIDADALFAVARLRSLGKLEMTGFLSDGTGFLSDGTGFLSDGTGFLSDGTGFLSDGTGCSPEMAECSSEGDLSKMKGNKHGVIVKRIVTPHEKELQRLLGLSSIEDVKNNRGECCKKFAKENNVVCLLKGHNTLVSDGSEIWQNKTGNVGMATAGSGDVLTGVLAGILAQDKVNNVLDVAKVGVFLHGKAGDLAFAKFGERSMIASDIIEMLKKLYF